MRVIRITHDGAIAAHCMRMIRFKDGLIRSDERVREEATA